MRTIRSKTIDSRTARLALEPDSKRWVKLSAELRLGYRRSPRGAGQWIRRTYIKESARYQDETFATADDYNESDGLTILNYDEAQAEAYKRHKTLVFANAGRIARATTVDDCMTPYFEWAKREGKSSAHHMQTAYNSFTKPIFGHRKAHEVTKEELEKWRDELITQPPSSSNKLLPRDFDPDDPDARRKRKVTANARLQVLKTGMHWAWKKNVLNFRPDQFEKAELFPKVHKRRHEYRNLTPDELGAVLAWLRSRRPDFANLLEAGGHTGARLQDVGRLTVKDFNPTQGTMRIQNHKADDPFDQPLTHEGTAFFAALARGKAPSASFFPEPIRILTMNGRWHIRNEWIEQACAAVGIERFTFHDLRHAYATAANANSVPPSVIAHNLGHHDGGKLAARTYIHSVASNVVAETRRGVATFGLRPPTQSTGKILPLKQSPKRRY
jgi:integrase